MRHIIHSVATHAAARLAAPLLAGLLAACSARNHIGAQGTGTAGVDGARGGTSGGSSGSGGTQGGSGGAAGGSSGAPGGSSGARGGSSGTTGQGGSATGSGGNAGAVAGSSGRAGTGGGASGGVTGGAGRGGASAGLQPRALIVDPATNRFLSYDRDGQPIHDFSANLDLGAGYGGRSIWRDVWMYMNWDGPPPSGEYGSPPPPAGLAVPPVQSVILIRGANTAGDRVAVKAVAANNTVLANLTLPGAWGGLQLSPGRAYLYAQATDNTAGTQVNALFRVSDGQMLWHGWAVSGGFSPDDGHFVYLPGSSAGPGLPHIIDLSRGAETTATTTQIPPLSGLTLGLYGVVNQWAVFGSQWNSYGLLLWAVDWQGTVTRFGADMPKAVDETLWGFDAAGTKAIFSRQANGSDGQPVSYLGAFQFDFAAKASTSWSGSDLACFGHPDAVAYRIVGSSVQSCSCADNTCHAIATLPTVSENGWSPRLLVSDDRQTMVIAYDWPLNRLPTSFPDLLALRASGEVIARIPYGFPQLDATGTLLLTVPFVSGPHSSQFGIANLVAGTVVWIDRAQGAAIIYE